MQLNPSEISELIKSKIQNLDTASQVRTQGTVVSVTDVHNEAVLTTYVQLVRQQRGLPAGAAFEIRHEDVDALADTLDLDDAELEARLVAIVGLPAEAAAGIRQRLLSRRRLGLPAGIVVTSLGLMPGAGGTDAQAAVVPPVAAVVAAPAPASALGATVGASAPASSEPAVWTTAQAPQAPQAPEDGPAAVAAAATPADIAPPTPAPERAMVAVTTPAIEIGEAVQIHNPQSPAAG